LVSIMAEISRNQVFDWWMAVRYIEQTESLLSEEEASRMIESLAEAEKAIRNLEDIADRIRRMMPGLPARTNQLLHACLVAVSGMELFQKIGVFIGVKEYHMDPPIEIDAGALAAQLEEWFLFYKEVWHSVSRESELYRIQEVVFRYADLLRE